jgi:hypothetical protein
MVAYFTMISKVSVISMKKNNPSKFLPKFCSKNFLLSQNLLAIDSHQIERSGDIIAYATRMLHFSSEMQQT